MADARAFAVKIDGTWSEIFGAFEDADRTSHAANVVDLWSPEELAAIGVAQVVEHGDTPAAGRPIIDVDGAPHREPLTVLEQQKAKREALADLYAAKQSRMRVIIQGQPVFLQCRDERDRTNWLSFKDTCDDGVAAGLGATTCPQQIRDEVNAEHQVTFSEGAQAMRDLRSFGGALMRHDWALKDAIDKAANQAALDAVAIDVGWPG